MTWLRRLGWTVLIVATAAAAAAVYGTWLSEPTGTIVVDHVRYLPDKGPGREVSLPHTLLPRLGGTPSRVRYVGHFDLARLPQDNWVVFVPTATRRASISLNGKALFDRDSRDVWSGPMVGTASLVYLPRALLIAGRNEIGVTFETGSSALPSYLSKIYVGAEAVLAPYFRPAVFFEERLKTMAFVAHVLLGLGILGAYLYRRNDPLFCWLGAQVAIGFALSIVTYVGFQPWMHKLLPYLASFTPTFGFVAIGVAFVVVGVQPPRVLGTIMVAVPAAMILIVASGLVPAGLFVTLTSITLVVASFVAATGVIAWGAFWRGNTDARLMLSPYFLCSWCLVRDVGVSIQLIDRPLTLVTPFTRPLLLAAILAVLMRRLALTLDDLDRSNENLNCRLQEQEAELAELHRAERIEAAREVRSAERQRLTHDLHDGISGHLVSIIAMSERPGADTGQIEQAAREALEDLRLVIYSLDLGDRELPLALANLRERLIPQLRRIGVELDWSTAHLPDVSGVTPGNALIILRILQEAITNALKHGPASKITIRGTAAENDMAAITIENDGHPFVPDETGLGLKNMRRRVHQLRGEIQISSVTGGVRLTLLLPLRLPDVSDTSRLADHAESAVH